MLESVSYVAIAVVAFIVAGAIAWIVKMYKKVEQGKALVRNGMGGTKVDFAGMFVVPVVHRAELMDISLKRIEIERLGQAGLICKDNLRADIKVAFFVRVNKTADNVLKVAESLGCARASQQEALIELFDAKFSEALKTIGKRFDFEELYDSRDRFKQEILNTIGTDLNGYVLEDAAIDHLEQTPLTNMIASNIFDAEGIKKITEITAREAILKNEIERNKEKIITQQDVEAREKILEMERQLAETEQKQAKEVATITAREQSEAERVQYEEKLKVEQSRIQTEEEIQVSEQNKQRQIIIAQRSKERTDAVETQRVDKDRLLELTEKEKIVDLATIEKERAVEEERRNIQEVIRERVIVEKAVVEEEEKIKDTRARAGADREKLVALTQAEQDALKLKIKEVTAAEAGKDAAKQEAEQKIIEADADRATAEKKAEAMKTIADARAVEEATLGLSEARVLEAKALAIEKQGAADAQVIEMKAFAEAKGVKAHAEATEQQGAAEAAVLAKKAAAEAEGVKAHAAALARQGEAEAQVMEQKAFAEAKGQEAKAVALEKEGMAQASVMHKKYSAEAQGIEEKAEAMKRLDGVGKEHEEFKLRLEKEKKIELAQITIQKDIAEAQADIIREGLKTAKIDIVGGDTMFFDQIVNSITKGKSVDRLVNNSTVLSDVKSAFFDGGGPEDFAAKLKSFVARFGLSSDDVKNLSISALMIKLMTMADEDTRGVLQKLHGLIQDSGMADAPAASILK